MASCYPGRSLTGRRSLSKPVQCVGRQLGSKGVCYHEMNTSVTKPRIVYLHGDNVLFWRWGWVATLADELRDRGYPTFFELFPDSIEARAQYWLPFLKDHVRAGPEDVLLGWSCGAVAAMRFAQSHPVGGLVLISPYFTDLGLLEVRRSGFVTEPWDWGAIRRNVSRVAIFHSDNDPYIATSEFNYLSRVLGAETFMVEGAGHFSSHEDFPGLKRYLLQVYP